MGDYYHHFLSSMSGVSAPQNHSRQDAQSLGPQQTPMPMATAAMSNFHQSLGYYTGFPDPMMFSAPKAQRSRRKSAPGLEHIKHRRTRSGCYTCRSRRVKCDEIRPVCERCKKGKRECVYPEPPTPKQAGGQASRDSLGSTSHVSPESADGEDDEDAEVDVKLEPIKDEEEHEEETMPHSTSTVSPPRRSSTTPSLMRERGAGGQRQSSETPSLEGTKSSSPSTSTGTISSATPVTISFSEPAFPHQSAASQGFGAEWSHLPHDLRFYLDYFCENMTNYHYCLVTDQDDFIRTILPKMAAGDEALLYAVVGFAAYHHTLRNPEGKMQEFLQYYNKSVTLLLGFLKNKGKHTLATLTTILQLATIEEYLGDWVNLMGHQRAAVEILTQLYTLESVMDTPTSRMILMWYSRFDICIAIMGNFGTSLPDEWFSRVVDYSVARIAEDPMNIGWKFERENGRIRLISKQLANLFARAGKGNIGGPEYAAEHARIGKQLKEWKEGYDPALMDPSYAVKDFSYRRAPDPTDIVDPYAPGLLYQGVYFQTTVLFCEWHSMICIHMMQGIPGSQPDAGSELMGHALGICQLFEAAEFWPGSPPGCLITLQAPLGLAALFVPRDSRHYMWMRTKFALLECMGYIFGTTTRRKLGEMFQDESCARWWLPGDDSFSPILRSIRDFADERNAVAVTAQSESLREVNHIFSKLDLGSDSSTTLPWK